ncbi:hypothetical protein B9Z55_025161 [Caenorhabditis nigoni]|uniref:Uncharacterized protein n=1 Tax=Caenorhabditis nigoni TaxID=1611254 RepID=A0A2G5SXL8_9PELO|nr:hypothetical protein B9Z55_025161 [Caenorhabditis nigoni]
MSETKRETIEKNIRIYKQEAEKMDALVKERFNLLTPPTDYCEAFTNYLAIILCENYIPWAPTQNREEFDFYGKSIVPGETRDEMKCRQHMIVDLVNLHLVTNHKRFYRPLMDWRCEQVHQTEALNELVKSQETIDFEKVIQRLGMQIEAVREMLCVIDITKKFDKEFDELLKSKNLEGESQNQPSPENGSSSDYLKPLKAIDAVLNTMEERAADRLEAILTTHRSKWSILEDDGLLALKIEEHLTAAEETLAKWQRKYSGKRVSRYLNAAEYYIKHVIEQLREYFIIASDYECYRKMAIRRTEEETRKKIFVEDTAKADETIRDVEKLIAEKFGCTSEKLRAAFEFDTTIDNTPKHDLPVVEQVQ